MENISTLIDDLTLKMNLNDEELKKLQLQRDIFEDNGDEMWNQYKRSHNSKWKNIYFTEFMGYCQGLQTIFTKESELSKKSERIEEKMDRLYQQNDDLWDEINHLSSNIMEYQNKIRGKGANKAIFPRR
ncbi:hypothetical protein RF11_08594 [Thelohanellus kitauei]|uniref:Uncharacterized protein n=1 Tax=Thelohanellus kitauei TaxID=669202 RepID=A0A0C2N2F5_THEKT|nr:hypothetical protein RF11_08594 [Thelohanellus kitauei]